VLIFYENAIVRTLDAAARIGLCIDRQKHPQLKKQSSLSACFPGSTPPRRQPFTCKHRPLSLCSPGSAAGGCCEPRKRRTRPAAREDGCRSSGAASHKARGDKRGSGSSLSSSSAAGSASSSPSTRMAPTTQRQRRRRWSERCSRAWPHGHRRRGIAHYGGG